MRRLVELLKQPNYSPYPVEEQVVSIWAGTEGKLDDIPVGDVRRFEAEFLQYLRHSHAGDARRDRRRRRGTTTSSPRCDEAIADFKQMFLAADGGDRRSTRSRPRRWARASRRRETVTRVKCRRPQQAK